MTHSSPSIIPYTGVKDSLTWFALPILITIPLCVFSYCIAAFGTGRGIGMAAVCTFVLWFLFEWIIPYRRDWSKRTDQQLYNNLFHITLSITGRIGLQQWFKVVVFVVISDVLIAHDVHHIFMVWPDQWPAIVQIMLCVFLAEGLNYGRHRLLHAVRWLWPIHALHHTVDRLHALKGGNTHIIEAASGVFIVAAPLILIGCPGDIFVWYGAVNMVFPTHANIRMTLPSFVHYLVVTPAVHYLHHSKNMTYGNGNYASVLPVWDILFGTYYHPDHHHYDTIGVEDDRMPNHLMGQLLSPFTWYRLKKPEV